MTPIAETRFYVDFLLNTARRGRLGETIAAMTPCMRLYAWLGQSLARTNVAPTYADWVKTYSDPGFEALAVRLEALLDAHASDTPAVRANYRRAMELETASSPPTSRVLQASPSSVRWRRAGRPSAWRPWPRAPPPRRRPTAAARA